MKPRSLEAVRRMALEDGAELVVNGRRFNSAQAEVPVRPKPAAVPLPPAPPPPVAPAGLTLEQVVMLLEAREAIWMEWMQAAQRAIEALQAGVNRKPRQWSFDVSYENGATKRIVATAIE